jgi:hypothetical protein
MDGDRTGAPAIRIHGLTMRRGLRESSRDGKTAGSREPRLPARVLSGSACATSHERFFYRR